MNQSMNIYVSQNHKLTSFLITWYYSRYCECFAAGVYCIGNCTCQGCLNKPEFEEIVLETRQQIESRNPLAFAPKIMRAAESSPSNKVILDSYIYISLFSMMIAIHQAISYWFFMFQNMHRRITMNLLPLQGTREVVIARNLAALKSIVNAIRLVSSIPGIV